MGRRLVKTVVTGAAVMVAALAGAAPSRAGVDFGPFIVTPGGNFTATGGTTLLKDTTTGATISCTASLVNAWFIPNTSSPGAGIGKINTMTFSSCTLAGITLTVTASATSSSPWPINLTSTTTGNATHVHITVSGTGCSLVLDGTSGSANNGRVRLGFPSAGVMKMPGIGGALHFWSVTGCFGLFSSGDQAELSATYKVMPPQTIT